MDNAPWHKKTMRLVSEESRSEYADIREKVEFVKLPPYSPDLNPIEYSFPNPIDYTTKDHITSFG